MSIINVDVGSGISDIKVLDDNREPISNENLEQDPKISNSNPQTEYQSDLSDDQILELIQFKKCKIEDITQEIICEEDPVPFKSLTEIFPKPLVEA